MKQRLQLFALLFVWLALTIYPSSTDANSNNSSHTIESVNSESTLTALHASLYNNYMQISGDHSKVAGFTDLVDFPLLVDITDPSLRDVLNGGYMENIDSKLDNSSSQL